MAARYGTITDPALRRQHQIRWFVYTGGVNEDGTRERIARTASMRGSWPGYEAECSCGWHSRTGGGVASWVESLVKDHKWDVENGFADSAAV